jgi:hypothetical protein
MGRSARLKNTVSSAVILHHLPISVPGKLLCSAVGCDERQVRKHTIVPNDSLVVELACGIGFLTWRLVAEGYSPVGIDFSE